MVPTATLCPISRRERFGRGAFGQSPCMVNQMTWKLVAGAAGAAAGLTVRAGLKATWKAARGEEPPENPASPATSWPEALAWAVASGVALAVARLVFQRGAAEAWRSATGAYPVDVERSGTAA